MKIDMLKQKLLSAIYSKYDWLTGICLLATVACAFVASSLHTLELPLTVIAGSFAMFSAAIYLIRQTGTFERERVEEQGNPSTEENQGQQQFLDRNLPSAYAASIGSPDLGLEFDIETFFVKNYLTPLQQSLPGHIHLSLIDPYRKRRYPSFYSGLFDMGYPVIPVRDIQSELLQSMLRTTFSFTTSTNKYLVAFKNLETIDEGRFIDMSFGGVEISMIDGVVSVRPQTQPNRLKKVVILATQRHGRYANPRPSHGGPQNPDSNAIAGFWQNFSSAESDSETLH